MAMQAGGWTITWQGTDTKAADFSNGQTIGRALVDAVVGAGGNATISPAGAYQTKPDVAVVVLGENPYAEFEGDVPDLAFRAKAGEEELIARLKSQGIRVVVVFVSGRPLFTGKLLNQADAFVAAWLPGTQGRGIADVLVAGTNGKPVRDFTGRLPFAWPADARSPISAPLFRVGFGLNYTQMSKFAVVNEDPGVDLSSANQTNLYMVRGKVPAPWRLALDGSISARSVDLTAQEDARQFTWDAAGALSIEGAAVNLERQRDEGFALLIDWRIDRPATGSLQIALGGASIDMAEVVRAIPTGSAIQTLLPLRCFSAAGAKLDTVGSPLRIQAAKGFVATIRNVRIETAKAGLSCPG
jgi:beta-glucosidase